jgi:hypothetical protein
MYFGDKLKQTNSWGQTEADKHWMYSPEDKIFFIELSLSKYYGIVIVLGGPCSWISWATITHPFPFL